jgi:plasmid stabilization system protein ParE
MYREYSPWIRIIPHKWYVIFYKIDDEKKLVEIITVVHWARDLNNLDIKKD